MTQVTANGNTYSDDGSTAKDMQNGGFRTWLLPMLSDVLSAISSALATVSGYVGNALSYANAASGFANAAAASAATAASAPGTSATSTTSLTIGLGTQNLTIQAGKSISLGSQMLIANTALSDNWMAGTVNAYNSSTGAITVNIKYIQGATTAGTAWTCSVTGVPGVAGVLNEILGLPIASAASINLETATGNMFHVTGTTTITTPVLNQGHRRIAIFDGVLTLTHNPSALNCPGAQSIITRVGDRAVFVGDSSGVVNIVEYTRADGTAVMSLGTGGLTTSTGNVTLLAASAGAQAITPTAPGQYVTLPDATTFKIIGNNVFSILNMGDVAYGIKDNAGNQLGWIPPHKAVIVGLAANSNAAGTWVIPGINKFAVTASFITSNGLSATPLAVCVPLDATRTLLLFSAQASSTSLFGIVYDASVQAFGSVTTIAASMASFGAILSGTNQVLVAYSNTGTSLSSLTLSISGTSITVNAATNTTIGAAPTSSVLYKVTQVGTSFVIGYVRGSVAAMVVVTISGTAVTAGAEVTLATPASSTAGSWYFLGASSTILLTAVQSGSTTALAVIPYTISGTGATVGTGVSLTGITSGAFKFGVVGSNWYAIYGQGTSSVSLQGSVLTLSGSTVTASTVGLATTSGTSHNFSQYDVCVIGNKVAFAGWVASASAPSFYCNALVNTAGVASSAGAAAISSVAVGPTCFIGSTGNVARFLATVSGSSAIMYGVDITGAAALSILGVVYCGGNIASSVPTAPPSGGRNGALISNGTSWYSPAQVWGLGGTSSILCPISFGATPDAGMAPAIQSTASLVSGANANETWNFNITQGLEIQRIECAA